MKFVLAEYRYKQKFEHIFQIYSGGLIFINDKGIVLDVNTHAEEIFHTNKNEVVGMNAMQLLETLHAKMDDKKAFFQRLFQFGYADTFCEVQSFAGEMKYIRLMVSKQKNSNLFLTEIHDESEVMNMKKRLNHTESLSTLGQLAASIAHEIRNPMTSLKGFTQLLYQSANEEGKRYLTVINDEIKRMEEILTEFLEVSKPTINQYSTIDMKDLILEISNFMAPQALLENINLIINFEYETEYKILGDRSLLKQVFINALKNAIEAMEDGGSIYINNFVSQDDAFACISIEDQGHGIEDKNLEKIFDPFFTTKDGGTGLGLPHVYKVIEAHGGHIEVSSTVGQGTTFKFLLPVLPVETSHFDNLNVRPI